MTIHSGEYQSTEAEFCGSATGRGIPEHTESRTKDMLYKELLHDRHSGRDDGRSRNSRTA
jgi:hypothetical protein